MSTTTTDILEEATARLVAALEEQVARPDLGAWSMPWHSLTAQGLPANAASRETYNGANVFVLWASAVRGDYRSPFWATYKQWSELGAQVRKGEKSTLCVRWVTLACKPAHGDDERCDRCGIMVPKRFNLFNAAQVDGWDAPTVEALPTNPDEQDQSLRLMFERLGSVVRHGERACYSPTTDTITVPQFERFRCAPTYWGTLAHEHIHWTGAKVRLARDLSGRFGSDSYAVEELVAELGAALLCARLGIENEPREDHAQYLASWLRVLKAEPKALWTAASAAQKAANYITERM